MTSVTDETKQKEDSGRGLFQDQEWVRGPRGLLDPRILGGEEIQEVIQGDRRPPDGKAEPAHWR